MLHDLHDWVEGYSLPLLKWSHSKTGNGEQARELAQEVWLQFFSAVRRERMQGREVLQPEHLLWKVARYVWCRQLRRTVSYRRELPLEDADSPAPSDFAADHAEREAQAQLIRFMRQCVVRLDRLQREILVMFYIDGLPQRTIADRLGISVSAVKWHLFDTRKQLREEIGNMKEQGFVYRPHKLKMALCGEIDGIEKSDIRRLEGSLIRQNICALCYREGRSTDELVELLGVPKAYIEFDLEWLVEKEFLIEKNGRYFTSFMIEHEQSRQGEYAVYLKHADALCNVLADGLLAAEEEIRSIGFHGCDAPMNKLLWLLIYRFCSYVLRPISDPLEMEAPIRPDGGQYFPLGFDDYDADCVEKVLDRSGWAANGAMFSEGFSWYGLYSFGNAEISYEIFDGTLKSLRLIELLKKIIDGGKTDDLDETQREDLAKLVQRGYLRMEEGRAIPTFCVMTEEQHRQLVERVYEPLRLRLESALNAFAEDIKAHCEGMMPAHLAHLKLFRQYMELMDLGFVSTLLAFRRGLLYVPEDEHDGEFLTLLYIQH